MSSSIQAGATASTDTLTTLVAVQKDGQWYRLTIIRVDVDPQFRCESEEAEANKKDAIEHTDSSGFE